MAVSPYKRKENDLLKERAVSYFKAGLSTREIIPLVNRSHVWIWKALKEKGVQTSVAKADSDNKN